MPVHPRGGCTILEGHLEGTRHGNGECVAVLFDLGGPIAAIAAAVTLWEKRGKERRGRREGGTGVNGG